MFALAMAAALLTIIENGIYAREVIGDTVEVYAKYRTACNRLVHTKSENRYFIRKLRD